MSGSLHFNNFINCKQEAFIVMTERNRRSMSRISSALLTPIVGAALLPLLVAGCSGKKQAAANPHAMGPFPVTVMAVQQKNVPIYGDWIGNLAGYVTANIQPQVSGYLIRQDYKEGSPVHKGQVLFQIDPRPFQATLDQAKGQLAQVQAQLQLANINVNRDSPLAKAHAIAQSTLDNDLQQQAAEKAALESAKASVETAQINLGFTKVRSLIDGIAGLAATQVGALVSPTTTLTTVSQVNPIKVYFSISEQEYLALSTSVRAMGKADLLDSGNAVPLQLTLANGQVYPHEGRIIFVDRAVNPQTGTILIAGSFANPRGLLRPGQFGHIKAETHIAENALLIPQQALNQLQGNYVVAVVGSDHKIHMTPVQLGPEVGNMQVINKGLQPGDLVVIQGIEKLRDGMPVVPHQVSAPAPDTDGAQSTEGN
ncbi:MULTISPECIES: efflux RND transporter periplasmic adaptor subunit [Acidobacterium]|nr:MULTISPECIES: efflux RND transporter periplasmic adaptor subunit [Acidobacterium]